MKTSTISDDVILSVLNSVVDEQMKRMKAHRLIRERIQQVLNKRKMRYTCRNCMGKFSSYQKRTSHLCRGSIGCSDPGSSLQLEQRLPSESPQDPESHYLDEFFAE